MDFRAVKRMSLKTNSDNFYKTPTLVEFPEEGKNGPTEIPKQIGIYKIESLLNRGGMSLLYLGIHPETHEPLAIKVLSSKYVSHPEMIERFMQEAQIIELTNHPNIVKIYGHGKWEGGLYIAMEFIQGISLRQLILQQSLSLKRSLEIVLQIAHALAHLHGHGIIHRDLKPENILLTAQGGIKVIDFGISLLYSQSEKEMPAKKRFLLGTPVYMSPEQRQNPFSVTYATDIYSLGIITYELILGRLSYGSIHLSLMPKGLQKILARALAPDPQDRYPDIIDFIKDLSAYLTSDDLKKDMRGSDYLGELSENLKQAQSLLVPSKLPEWPRIEMALASNSNSAISAVYYDFFMQKPGIYTIVMGEALATGVEGLLYIAILRGMIRALAHEIENPKDLVNALNERIVAEGKDQAFSLAYLTLVPSEDRFSYISCGYSPLWYLPAGAATPRRLTADNVALGIVSQMDAIELTSNFNIGDALILHTFQAGTAKNISEIEQDESYFMEALMENLYLTPQRQVDSIFRKVAQRDPRTLFERPVTLISIHRIE